MGILNPAGRATYTKDQILELVRLANRLYDSIEGMAAHREGRPPRFTGR
jgi:hypothetical protein